MSVGDDYVWPRGLESQCVKGDIVTDMHSGEEIQCLQCFADLRTGGHLGTCSHSVMRGGSRMLVVRFVGDPRGYRVGDLNDDGEPHGWHQAEIGISGRTAWINLDQAYVIESEDA